MRGKVVEASALAALLFGEPAAEEVADRLGEGPLFAPTLLRYEVASVCLKKLRRNPERRDQLLDALGLLGELDIDEVQVPSGETVALAEEVDLTAYDAAYLWLSRWTGAELVTLDERLEEA
ncbi:MAG: type II toxin-antitoxin system VapC family toxin [Gemmatimonadota bacterium]|nr:type II toxin-antitoxin system VapC family toxin [Gemmatimonadota bacterium]